MKKTINKGLEFIASARLKVQEKKGEFIMNNAAAAIGIVVLAGVVILVAGNYLEDEFLPMLMSNLTDLFNIG